MTTKGFLLRDLFSEIIKGEYHVSSDLDFGSVPLISCTTFNKGIEGYFDIPLNHTYNDCITIACDGEPLTSFYHNYPIAAKDNVLICIPKKNMKLTTVYYIISFLNKSKWKFSYGRKFYYNKINKIQIIMPIKENGEIDESFIEKIIKYKFEDSDLNVRNKNIHIENKIALFKLSGDKGICNITRKYAPYMNELEIEKDGTPYVTTTEEDNGISIKSNAEPNFKKFSLSVSLDGTCGTTFFQFNDFTAGEKTAVITLKNKTNPYLLFYIGAIIRMKSWRYHYGRKLSIGRLSLLEIPFPVDDSGSIDLKLIENIVKNSFGWKIIEKNIKL